MELASMSLLKVSHLPRSLRMQRGRDECHGGRLGDRAAGYAVRREREMSLMSQIPVSGARNTVYWKLKATMRILMETEFRTASIRSRWR